jgi:hypothetical protein
MHSMQCKINGTSELTDLCPTFSDIIPQQPSSRQVGSSTAFFAPCYCTNAVLYGVHMTRVARRLSCIG